MKNYLYFIDNISKIDTFPSNYSENEILLELRTEYGTWVNIEPGYFV